MKKVLFISYDGMTDQLGQSQVIPYLRELSKSGYEFTILSMEKKEKLALTGPVVAQQLKQAGIGWETLSFTRRPPIISKYFDQKRLNRKAARLHREKKFDMVHCRSYVPAEAGMRLAKKTGIPFLFDMRGFWVDERVDSGLWDLKKPFYRYLYKIYKAKEKEYFSTASHVISLTEKGRLELNTSYKVPLDKISVIPCCADLDHFDYHSISEEEKAGARARLSIPSKAKVLSYLGSLGGWYLTGEMLDFFVVLKRKIPEAIFLLITHDNKEEVMKKAKEKGIDASDIRVQPAQRKEVPLFLSLSDWNVFFIKDVYSKVASSPTKQGEVLAMGIPVICNDIGDTGRIVEETGTGVVLRSFDKAEYDKAISQLPALSGKDKNEIRDAAKKYYDLQVGATCYKKVYSSLINPPSNAN